MQLWMDFGREQNRLHIRRKLANTLVWNCFDQFWKKGVSMKPIIPEPLPPFSQCEYLLPSIRTTLSRSRAKLMWCTNKFMYTIQSINQSINVVSGLIWCNFRSAVAVSWLMSLFTFLHPYLSNNNKLSVFRLSSAILSSRMDCYLGTVSDVDFEISEAMWTKSRIAENGRQTGELVRGWDLESSLNTFTVGVNAKNATHLKFWKFSLDAAQGAAHFLFLAICVHCHCNRKSRLSILPRRYSDLQKQSSSITFQMSTTLHIWSFENFLSMQHRGQHVSSFWPYVCIVIAIAILILPRRYSDLQKQSSSITFPYMDVSNIRKSHAVHLRKTSLLCVIVKHIANAMTFPQKFNTSSLGVPNLLSSIVHLFIEQSHQSQRSNGFAAVTALFDALCPGFWGVHSVDEL
jgi:hypothetical protein